MTDTAIIMFSDETHRSERRMSAGWGDREGHWRVTVEAALAPGGNPRVAENWRILGVTDDS